MSIDRTKILEQAQKHLAKGALDKAIAEYLRLVQADPGDVRTWLKIGDLYTQRGQKREAIETYSRVAETYAQQGFFLKAVAVYKQILKLDPSLLDAQLRLGDMYEQLALISDALAAYEQVAQQYARSGQIDKALATLGRMAELDPDNVPVRIKLAEGLSKAGRTEEAAREFEVGCRLLEEQGRVDDFIKVAERLLYHRPNDAALSKKLARLYLERGDAKRALAKLQVAFKADPKDVETLDLLADAFLGLQQLPKTISVLKEIARIHGDAKRPAERMAVLRRILDLDPGDPDARQAVAAAARETAASQAALTAPPKSAVVGGSTAAADEEVAKRESPARGVREESELDEGEVVDADEAEVLVDEEDENAQPALVAATRDASGAGTALPAAGSDRRTADAQREAQIARMLGEVDVFKRYGLRHKVIEQLERIVEMVPDHVQARERLAEAYTEAGRPVDAARQLAALADAFLDDAPHVAVAYLRRVVALDPSDEEARGKLSLLDEDDTEAPLEARAPQAPGIPPSGSGARPAFAPLPAGPGAQPAPGTQPAPSTPLTGSAARPAPGTKPAPGTQPAPSTPLTGSAARPAPGTKPAPGTQPAPSTPLTGSAARPAPAAMPSSLIAKPAPAVQAPTVSRPVGPSIPRDLPAPAHDAAAAAAAMNAEATDHALGGPGGLDGDDAVLFIEDDEVARSRRGLDATPPPSESSSFDEPTMLELATAEPGAFGLPPTTPGTPRSARVVAAAAIQEFAEPATVLEHRLEDDTGEDLRPLPATSVAAHDADARSPAVQVQTAHPGGYVPPMPRASMRPAGPAVPDIEEVLEEAEFFVAQGLFEEARSTLSDALAAHPQHRLLLEKLAEVEDLAAGGTGAVGLPPDSIEPGETDDAFMLAEKLAEEFEPADGTAPAADVLDVDEVFAQFKKGVEENIGLEDSDTHFDLGIAYKEMGLLDDAIHEFKLAMNNPQKECLAETMIGLCYMEKGKVAEAISHFKKGLYSEHKNEREELGLYFELGVAYEVLQDPKEALYYFQKVQKRDPSFRGVGAKIKALLQPRPPAIAPPSPPESSAEDVDRAFDDLLGDGSER